MVIGEVPIGADVLVVGAGRSGRAVIEVLAGQGRRVVVADAAVPAASRDDVTWLTGTARFSTARRVAVSDGDHVVHVEAIDVVVATGSVRPPAPVPGAPVTVVGGDDESVQRAFDLARRGAIVTFDPVTPLLPTAAPWVASSVLDRLATSGVHVVEGSGRVGAAPRRAATGDLGLEHLDRVRRRDDGSLVCDDLGRAAPHLYAVGAAAGRPTGFEVAEAVTVAAAIAGVPVPFEPGVVPVVVESGDWAAWSVGAIEGARRGRIEGDVTVEVIADAAGTVVGAHAVGPGAAAVLGGAVLAVELAAVVDDLVFSAAVGPGSLLAAAAASARERGDGVYPARS
jgi:pyruvate/2-oxoglutarate dehydrogenase complex dihydrolipoamide dehydrogenase (E3) component